MISKESVYHRAYGNWAYYINKTTVKLVIKTKKNNVKKVVCEYYDKYENIAHSQIVMQKSGSDELFDYYSANIMPPFKRLSYFFIISADKNYVYKQYGFTSDLNGGDFQLPYINPSDIYEIPDWINDAVFYQIFPDSFDSSDQNKNLSDNYFGGTLKGITKNVDYLKRLGVNVVYLNPIFCSTTSHRYDVTDYFNIDPILGTKKDFRDLVKTLHENGIRIVLDAVLNHSSNKNPLFLDVLENGSNSRFADFYVINSYKKGKPYNYDRFAFEDYMPKLNTSNKDVVSYLCSVLTYWINEFDIDGWRIDVGNEIGHEFMKEARRAVKNAKPDAYLLGEIWHDSFSFLFGDEYDGVTNFTLKDLLFKFFKNQIDAKTFVNCYNRYYFSLPKQAVIASSNFLCNHDTVRVNSEIKNENTLKAMIALQFIVLGTPLIYYGQEIGMEQNFAYAGDKGARTPFKWNNVSTSEWLKFYRKLIKLKTKNECLKFGNMNINHEKDLIIVSRTCAKKEVLLIINNTDKNKKYLLKDDYKDYLEQKFYTKNTKLQLLSNQFIILTK